MTDDKKNGEITEPVKEEKTEIEGEGKEAETDKEIVAEEGLEVKEEVKEPEKEKEEIKEEKSASEAVPEDQKIETKEEKKEESPEEVIEAKPEETVAEDTEKKEDEPVEEKKSKQDLGNLNFYPELRTDIPEIRSGDVLKVFYRVLEGGKERIQVFEGTVIAMKNSGIAKTITVRKTSFGIAIERIFPLNSKLVQKIEVIKHSRVRRAKLYYLRKLKGKAARLKELR